MVIVFQPDISSRSGLTAIVPQKTASVFRRPGSPHASRIVDTTVATDFQSIERNASIGTLSRVAPIPTLQRANINITSEFRGPEDILDYTVGSLATRMGIPDTDPMMRACGMRRVDTLVNTALLANTIATATTLFVTEFTGVQFTIDGTTAKSVKVAIGWGTATGETQTLASVRQATLTVNANYTGGTGDTLTVVSTTGINDGDVLVVDPNFGSVNANREVATVLSHTPTTITFTALLANDHIIGDLIRLDGLVFGTTARNHTAADKVLYDVIVYSPESSQSQIRDAAVPTAVTAGTQTINLMPGTAAQFIAGDFLVLGGAWDPNREPVVVHPSIAPETGATTAYASTSAADTIVVTASTGFATSDIVWIGRGTANAERKIVLSIPDGTHIRFTTNVGTHSAGELVQEEDTITVIGGGATSGVLFDHNKVTYISTASVANGVNKTITVPTGTTTNFRVGDSLWIDHAGAHEEAIIIAGITATTIVATSFLTFAHDPGEIVTSITLEATDTVFECSVAHQDDGGQSSTTPLEIRALGLRGDATLSGEFGQITKWEFNMSGGWEDFADPTKAGVSPVPRSYIPILPLVQPEIFADTCLYVGPAPEFNPSTRSFAFRMGNQTTLIPNSCTSSGIKGQSITSRRVQLEFLTQIVPPGVFDWVAAFELTTQIQYRMEVRKTSRRRCVIAITKGIVSGISREVIDDLLYFRVTIDAIVPLGVAPTGDNEFSITYD